MHFLFFCVLPLRERRGVAAADVNALASSLNHVAGHIAKSKTNSCALFRRCDSNGVYGIWASIRSLSTSQAAVCHLSTIHLDWILRLLLRVCCSSVCPAH